MLFDLKSVNQISIKINLFLSINCSEEYESDCILTEAIPLTAIPETDIILELNVGVENLYNLKYLKGCPGMINPMSKIVQPNQNYALAIKAWDLDFVILFK